MGRLLAVVVMLFGGGTNLFAQIDSGPPPSLVDIPEDILSQELDDEDPIYQEPAAPIGHDFSVFVGSPTSNFKGIADLDSDGGLAFGFGDRFDLTQNIYLDAAFQYVSGSWAENLGDFTLYDLSADFLSRMSLKNGDGFTMGLRGRARELSNDGTIAAGFGGYSLFDVSLVAGTDFRFARVFVFDLHWSIMLLSFGNMEINKEDESVLNGIAQEVKARLGYMPLNAPYAIYVFVSTDDKAFEFDQNRVVKNYDTMMGVGGTWKL